METPLSGRTRSRHVPTPKMSERKKSLFTSQKDSPILQCIINEDSDLGPMNPLELSPLSCNDSNSDDDLNHRKPRYVPGKSTVRTNFKNILNELSPARSSFKDTGLESDVLMNSPKSFKSKENILKTPSVQKSTNFDTPKISHRKSNIFKSYQNQTPSANNNNSISSTPTYTQIKWPQKRHFQQAEPDDICPPNKQQKIESKARTSLSFETFMPTTMFYAQKPTNTDEITTKKKEYSPPNLIIKSPRLRSVSAHKTSKLKHIYGSINKGVGHRILKKKPRKTLNTNKALEKKSSVSSRISLAKFNLLKKSILYDKTKEDKEDTRITMEQIQRITNIIKNIKNPIELAKPLTCELEKSNLELGAKSGVAIPMDKFQSYDEGEMTNKKRKFFKGAMSSIAIPDEFQSDDDEEEVNTKKRKFFKTDRSRTKNHFHYASMNATMVNGKISLIPPDQNDAIEEFGKEEEDCTDVSNEVEDIITRLSKQMCDDFVPSSTNTKKDETEINADSIENFKSRLPYNTTDEEEIKRQYNLFDFLIYNNLLTEENFKIFITEPDKHTEEACKIIDELIVVVDEPVDYYNDDNLLTEDDIYIPMSPEGQISSMTSSLAILCPSEVDVTATPADNIDDYNLNRNVENILIETYGNQNNNESIEIPLCNDSSSRPSTNNDNIEVDTTNKTDENIDIEKIFPIFKRNFTPKVYLGPVSNKKKSKQWKPIGSNQYQIDAGQKEFGAKECKECGLIYSMHEPEDEKIHMNFHTSNNLFKFRGWSNETIVAHIDEWGVEGRIIAIRGNDSKSKLSRVREILAVADKELGFSNTNWDKKSIVYMAIAKGRIIGICVAHPKSEAHRFIEQDNGDFCSEQSYPVKCGIMKIWIAPPNRRTGVAGRLIHAVRAHFIFGHIMSYDDLAFSSPTYAGKALAKKLTNRPDFLVYQ